MNDFWQRLKQHNILRIAAAYLVAGWIVMQIVEVMGPALRLPAWVLSAVAFILIFGLPIVLLIAWSLEHKKKEAARSDTGLLSGEATGKLDYVLFGGVAFVLVLVLTRWGFPSEAPGSTATATEQALVAENPPDKKKSNAVFREKSIAVLPFVDMSEEQDQEYFSDGVTEEIIGALNGIDDLKVTGRTSSFAFKGRNEDLKGIGRVLKVAHVLEGSVRKQGDRVRITAQLIEVEEGFHLWSDTYDRPLEDVLAVQEEIAIAITNKLRVLLATDEKKQLAQSKKIVPEAYEAYFQAKYLLANTEPSNASNAVALLEDAVALDPKFAQGWATMATAHLISLMDGTDFEKKHKAAELSALRAIAISPDVAEAYATLGWIQVQRRDYLDMDSHFEKALALNADDPQALNWTAYGLLSAGKPREAVAYFERAIEVDPIQPSHRFFLATALLMAGELEGAETAAKQARAFGFMPANLPLADIAALRGEGARAVKLARPMVGMLTHDFGNEEIDLIVSGTFAGGDNRTKAIELMKSALARPDTKSQIFFPNFFILLDEPELAFDTFENDTFAFDLPFYVALWGPFGRSARQHPDFPAFAKRIGLVDYWQENGWPELCKPSGEGKGETTDVTFTCS